MYFTFEQFLLSIYTIEYIYNIQQALVWWHIKYLTTNTCFKPSIIVNCVAYIIDLQQKYCMYCKYDRVLY